MLKSKFKIFAMLITVIIAVCCAFAGCKTSQDYEEIYNDDAVLAKSSSSVRIMSVSSSKKGGYEFSCDSLSGVYIAINNFSVEESASAELSFSVTEGKGKLVLVNGGTVYTVAEGGYEGSLNFENVPEGKYKLKLVGVEAQIKLTLKY